MNISIGWNLHKILAVLALSLALTTQMMAQNRTTSSLSSVTSRTKVEEITPLKLLNITQKKIGSLPYIAVSDGGADGDLTCQLGNDERMFGTYVATKNDCHVEITDTLRLSFTPPFLNIRQIFIHGPDADPLSVEVYKNSLGFEGADAAVYINIGTELGAYSLKLGRDRNSKEIGGFIVELASEKVVTIKETGHNGMFGRNETIEAELAGYKPFEEVPLFLYRANERVQLISEELRYTQRKFEPVQLVTIISTDRRGEAMLNFQIDNKRLYGSYLIDTTPSADPTDGLSSAYFLIANTKYLNNDPYDDSDFCAGPTYAVTGVENLSERSRPSLKGELVYVLHAGAFAASGCGSPPVRAEGRIWIKSSHGWISTRYLKPFDEVFPQN